MKIKNKLDMLGAMSDINEEYVRKADRLLMRHKTGETAVKMEITPMKFSWKPIAAAAACLAVLIGAAFGIKALMNRPHIVTPVDVLTAEQQAYLDEWKDKLGGSVNVAYAVDRLNFVEIEIPEDVVPLKFIDENRAVFIREEKRGDEFVKTLEIYSFADKSYSVIAELDLVKHYDICYADSDYVIYYGDINRVTGVFIPGETLHLYNVKTGENTVILENGGISYQIPMTVSDGKVYFTVYSNLGENSLHVYDTATRQETTVIANAGSPQKYKGDILYITEENGRIVTRSLSGKYSFDGGVWATEYGLYQYNYTGEERLKDLESGKVIIPGDTKGIVNLDDSCDFAMQFGGVTINSTAVAQNALGFLFYAPTGEALVFQNGDGFSGFSCFGWGATISKKEPDGTSRIFIVTDKESENSVKIPKLGPDSYLEEMKNIFGAQGSVDYARNKLDIKEYDLPGFESRPLLVDKDRAVVTGKDDAGYPEIRLHDLNSGEQTTLYSRKNDSEIDPNTEIELRYTNKDYTVFEIKFYQGETAEKHELRIVEIKSGRSYTAHTIYFNNSVHHIMVIVDGSLYFYESSTIYRYKIGLEEKAVSVGHGVGLMAYNGNVYYTTTGSAYDDEDPGSSAEYTIYTYTYMLDGEMPVDTKKYKGGLLIGKTGIFHNDGQTIADCVNDETLLSFNTSGHLFAKLYDSMMIIIEDKIYQNKNVIYNTKTNELLVFAKGDDLYYDLYDYREFDGGMYYALESNGVYNKLCVITEKGSQNEIKPDPKPEHPTVERNYISNVPEAELSDMIEIVSEEFSLPEKILGYDEYYTTGFADRTKLRIILEDDAHQNIEYGIYDLESGNYLTLLDMRAEPQSFTLYGQCGRYVYCPGGSGMWTVADIESDPDISKAKIFEIGKGLYPLNKFTYRDDSMALGSDGRIYFNALDKEPEYDEYGRTEMSSSQSALYRFDPSTGETEKLLDNAFLPRDLGDEILYDTNETGNYFDVMLKSLSGNISLDYSDYYQPSDNYRSGIILCGSSIFGMELSDPLDWSSKKLLKNLLTDEIILEDVKEIVCYAVTDNILRIDTFKEDGTILLYFVNENKLVSVYKGDIPHIDTTYDGIGLITWPEGLTRDGKLYTFSMK